VLMIWREVGGGGLWWGRAVGCRSWRAEHHETVDDSIPTPCHDAGCGDYTHSGDGSPFRCSMTLSQLQSLYRLRTG
jgi:hypothetical protein